VQLSERCVTTASEQESRAFCCYDHCARSDVLSSCVQCTAACCTQRVKPYDMCLLVPESSPTYVLYFRAHFIDFPHLIPSIFISFIYLIFVLFCFYTPCCLVRTVNCLLQLLVCVCFTMAALGGLAVLATGPTGSNPTEGGGFYG
jgi:hypothetical protein